MTPRDPLTAIICDDAPGFRAMMGALLAEAGFDVRGQAETWEEAERLAAAGPLDAIVCDLWMPELDLEALTRVRASAPAAMVAVLTALPLTDARGRLADAGAGVDLLLSKSDPPEQVVAAIAAQAARAAGCSAGSSTAAS